MQLDKKFKNNLLENDKTEEDEYLTNPENNRLTVYPIKNPSIWESYKKQQASFWTAEEVDLSKDEDDFKRLSSNEQYFIKHVLAFFSSSDTIVNINIGERFSKDVKIREAIVCYNYQMMMENIHSEMYSLQIDNIVRDADEKTKLLDALLHFPCIAKKAEWQMKWIESDKPFAYRLIAFAIVEGVFFSGSFCSIFWLKQRNVMPGLCASNELIARDEGMHTNFAILLYSMIKNRVPEKDIHLMFKDAVMIETEFICDSLPCALLGINQDSMTVYIQYVADRLLVELGYNKIWNVKNPFDFMEKISMEGKTNFFEARPTQYQKSSVMNKTREDSFNMTEDF
jgi:ribonucleotide reductase beta subunit family protein with ferritin-like domain